MTNASELADVYVVEEQGSAAQKNGEAPWANPYVFGTLNQRLWEKGWDRANEASA